MKTIEGLGNWVLIVMAIASLVSMIAAYQVDMIVHVDLYSYGLQFSAIWADPYWAAIRLIFAMSWLSLIATIAFQVYKTMVLRSLTEESEQLEVTVSSNSENEILEKAS